MKYYSCLLLFTLFMTQCRYKEENTLTLPAKADVPASIKKEHENLLRQFQKFSSFEDSAVTAAEKLQDLMQHHFTEEENFVLPLLGLLPMLAKGSLPAESNEITELSEKLESHLAHLSVEHQLIQAYLEELKQVAPEAAMPEIIEFEKQLQKHAETEEEVFFPASLLVVEYLKLKTR